MKRGLLVLSVTICLVLFASVIVQSAELSQKDVEDKLKEKGKTPTEIKEVDYNNLPGEIKIENIGETGVTFYEANVGEEKPVFIITSSKKTTETTSRTLSRTFLNFGLNEEINESTYLQSATGTNLETQGYVMMRAGSITGISTTLNVLSGKGQAEIIIYKNNEEVGFRNTINIASTGKAKDFDLQSSGVIEFQPGDEISTSIKLNGNTKVKDIVTLLEITTD